MIRLLSDPFFYLNYASASLAIFLVVRFGEKVLAIGSRRKSEYVYTVLLFFVIVFGLAYFSYLFGTLSLINLGVKP